METCGGRVYSSVLRSGRFNAEERALSTPWIGGCVGPQPAWKICKIDKALALSWKCAAIPQLSCPWTSHYINCAIRALFSVQKFWTFAKTLYKFIHSPDSCRLLILKYLSETFSIYILIRMGKQFSHPQACICSSKTDKSSFCNFNLFVSSERAGRV
jgi:hypothetical protein